MLTLRDFDAMTFDCYGTLIDWESGLAQALQPILRAHDIHLSDDQALEAFAAAEAAAEQGIYAPYREVLAAALRAVGERLGFAPSAAEQQRFSDSVGDWPPFADSAEALARIKRRFRLGVITNCDDDLFARSSRRLGVAFDWVITAQQARSYKPALRNFELAFERIDVPRARILHVAQSLYHDHVPAKQVGLATVWVNRRHDKAGFGATPPAAAAPDLEVPDLHTLTELAVSC